MCCIDKWSHPKSLSFFTWSSDTRAVTVGRFAHHVWIELGLVKPFFYCFPAGGFYSILEYMVGPISRNETLQISVHGKETLPITILVQIMHRSFPDWIWLLSSSFLQPIKSIFYVLKSDLISRSVNQEHLVIWLGQILKLQFVESTAGSH